ncbi:hypothetical protein [Leptothoe spongobia]|uniref:Uncharacterized protein n=1 Tax=Leptothoe spongobia TAU-MAC 1115 TaxID=1967444 RepID=A0A947DDU5_9CYAN|nr:hypothetical protein [Leptothoe spongobia]MBT9314749.1 hypothetical protein [Leptothoe spongobia TAU-MAC 1115]
MSFVFILPVVHPQRSKVSNYHHVEIALKQTLESLQNQTYNDAKIIVVCCQIPSWADRFNQNVFFLDVSNSEIFSPDRNNTKVDKGLKYSLGILYATAIFQPRLYMLADADDYVNTQLADYALNSLTGTFGNKDIDGYLVDKGLQVEVDISSEEQLEYKAAYLIKHFNTSCGTCRVFKQESLAQKLLEIDSNIFQKSKQWIPNQLGTITEVPSDLSIWLDRLCSDSYLENWHIVNVLGRHIKQDKHFNFILFPHVGAAKACGHGNHDGPREGGLNQKKIIGQLATSDFKKKFGIAKKRAFDFSLISDLKMKIAFRLNQN